MYFSFVFGFLIPKESGLSFSSVLFPKSFNTFCLWQKRLFFFNHSPCILASLLLTVMTHETNLQIVISTLDRGFCNQYNLPETRPQYKPLFITIKEEIFVWEFLPKLHFIGNSWENWQGHKKGCNHFLILWFLSCPAHFART